MNKEKYNCYIVSKCLDFRFESVANNEWKTESAFWSKCDHSLIQQRIWLHKSISIEWQNEIFDTFSLIQRDKILKPDN